MGRSVRFVVPGNPRGKGAAKSSPWGTYTDKATREEMEAIRAIARRAMDGQPPFTGPVQLKLAAYMAVPKSWSNVKRHDALAGRIRPTVKPDADNIQKLMDGIQPPPSPKRKKFEPEAAFEQRRAHWERQKVILVDDSQIVEWQGWKLYSDDPRLVVVVTELDP
jgi:Holliday junction resolvase RusA-like endonuclease